MFVLANLCVSFFKAAGFGDFPVCVPPGFIWAEVRGRLLAYFLAGLLVDICYMPNLGAVSLF